MFKIRVDFSQMPKYVTNNFEEALDYVVDLVISGKPKASIKYKRGNKTYWVSASRIFGPKIMVKEENSSKIVALITESDRQGSYELLMPAFFKLSANC